jgi:hypothetical protein
MGNDTITGTNTGDGAGIGNFVSMDTGNGDDIITGTSRGGAGIVTGGFSPGMNTGNGDDIITGTNTTRGGEGILSFRFSSINTGDGNDTIIGSGSIGIKNDGTINTGNGADLIVADGGFDGSGEVFLGKGTDYLKGFGSGNFNGGNDQDSLELTSGSYTIGIVGAVVSFTKGSSIMKTSDFEILIAGNTSYDIASLMNGQTITIG